MVNDGSIDGTWPLILEIMHKDPDITVALDFAKNAGQIAAMTAGLKDPQERRIAIERRRTTYDTSHCGSRKRKRRREARAIDAGCCGQPVCKCEWRADGSAVLQEYGAACYIHACRRS